MQMAFVCLEVWMLNILVSDLLEPSRSFSLVLLAPADSPLSNSKFQQKHVLLDCRGSTSVMHGLSVQADDPQSYDGTRSACWLYLLPATTQTTTLLTNNMHLPVRPHNRGGGCFFRSHTHTRENTFQRL